MELYACIKLAHIRKYVQVYIRLHRIHACYRLIDVYTSLYMAAYIGCMHSMHIGTGCPKNMGIQ